MEKFKILLLLMFVSCTLASGNHDSPAFPRPLILEIPQQVNQFELTEELRLHCASWRFAAETNNLSPWRTVAPECAGYVEDYMTGRGYVYDLKRVSNEAWIFADSVKLGDDGKDVWIFDVDETLLSNLPYYSHHGYGLELFDHAKFDLWVEEGTAPAIHSSLELYQHVLNLGLKVILLTGRKESHRSITEENLTKVGFHYWDKLLLRILEAQGRGCCWRD